jgi:hypothetical protein
MTISRLRNCPDYLYTLGMTLYPPEDVPTQQHARWKVDTLKRLSIWKYPPSKARDFGTYLFVEWIFDEGCDGRGTPPPEVTARMWEIAEALAAVWGGSQGYNRTWDDGDNYTVMWCDEYRTAPMADVLRECQRVARLVACAERAETKRQLTFAGVMA